MLYDVHKSDHVTRTRQLRMRKNAKMHWCPAFTSLLLQPFAGFYTFFSVSQFECLLDHNPFAASTSGSRTLDRCLCILRNSFRTFLSGDDS